MYYRPMNQTRLFSFIALMVLSACNLAQALNSEPTPTVASPIRVVQVQISPIPTTTRALQAIPTLTPTITPTESPLPTAPVFTCEPSIGHAAIRHEVEANLDYVRKQVQVQQTIRYANRTDGALDNLVLDIEANNWEGGFGLESLLVGESPLPFTLNRNQLSIELPTPLETGCEVLLRLRFVIQVPAIRDGISSYRGFFGYSERQLNLGHWLPTVAAYVGNQWVVHEPIGIGEQIVFEQADWDVTLNVVGTGDTLELAAPGKVEKIGETAWHIIHTKSRDFAISLSEFFKVTQQDAGEGIIVELYAFSDTVVQTPTGAFDGAKHALKKRCARFQFTKSYLAHFPMNVL